jgi:hypothetical protein
METPVLTNKNLYPTEELFFSNLGKTITLWQSVFDYIHSSHPEMTEQWKYYNDGKSWLMKVSSKSKTVCWVSVIKNSFRMTFYLNDRAEKLIMQSKIPDELKKQYLAGRKIKKINGLTVIFKSKKDVETAKKLFFIKLNLK